MIWFVHASTGSDSNVGRKDAPFLTLAKLATVMVPGDRAYLAGTFRENVTFSGLRDNYIGQWIGQTKYTIRGDTVITGFSASGAGYTKTLAAGLNIKSVVVNWDTNVNQNGLHYGHLDLAADAATALTGPNKWFYNSGTGVLSINTGANPATQTVAWCKGGVTGFNAGNCTNCVFDNFKAALWCDSTPGFGYAFIAYGTGNVLRIDRTDDCGYHHCGFVGGNCTNNVIEPSTGGEGVCAGNASGGIPLVFYTDQSSQAGNVGRDIRIFASPFLKLDGATGTHTGTLGGVYSHTNGVQVLDGVTWERIWITYPYTVGVNSCGVDAGNTTRVGSANETSYLNYGVKAIECRIDGAGAPGLNLNGGMADVRCSYNFAGGATKSQSTGILYSTASGVARTRLMDSCEILCNLGNSGVTAANVVRGWTNDRWVFLNCSFAESGTGTNERRFFAPVGSSASIKAKQCIFAFTTSAATFRRFYNGDGGYDNANVSNGIESLPPRNFEDCAYMGIATGQYSSYTTITYNTSAGWTTNLDAGAQHTSTNPFEEPATHARLKRSHALWTYRDTGTSAHSALGINRKGWTGTLGCYQLNAAATTNWPALTDTPPPTRRRPAVWVNFQTGATTNPYRIRQDLFDDPETYLEAVFAKAGAAHMDVIFYVPGGHNGTHYYPATPWQGVANRIKDVLWSKIEEWRYTYMVSHVGVYQGAVWYSEASNTPIKPLMFPDWEDESVSAVFDSWMNMGFDTYGFDAVSNRGSDQYSTPVKDTWDTLGGYCYWACGMLPIGEAIEVDNPVTTTDFDTDMAERAEYMIVDTLYTDSAPSDFADVLDGTLPPTRMGFHWLYFASEFAAAGGRAGAQARINQGYIVDVYEDLSTDDTIWVGGQTPVVGSPGASGTPSSETDFEPPVPPPPDPNPSGRRSRRSSRSVRSRIGV